MKSLLFLALLFVLSHAQDLVAPEFCGTMYDVTNSELEFNQTNRNDSLKRFCTTQAGMVRQEHFWCGGYVDEYNNLIPGTEREGSMFPGDSTELFWSIFLQYPALSWMDIARKEAVLSTIRSIAVTQQACATGVSVLDDFCVSNVAIYDITTYRESVLITLYNLGVNGETFDGCFQNGLQQEIASGNSVLATRFRGKRALNLTIDRNLTDMFTLNIGPASSIGNPNADPTMRPVYLGSWPQNVTLDFARRRVNDDDFASNPNPRNYGLEDGDIVFAVFGSILLLGVAILVVLGFFIHPFFLS